MRMIFLGLWVSASLAAVAALIGIVSYTIFGNQEIGNVAFGISVSLMAASFLIALLGHFASGYYKSH